MVGVPILLMVVTLWPSLHFVWTDRSTYSHGYLVLALALWLSWTELRRAPLAPFAPSGLGAATLAASLIAALLGRSTDIALLAQLSVPAVVFSGFWAAAGWGNARRFVVPAAFMVFAMPIWDAINGLLREITVDVVGTWTRWSSIPALIEGNFIRIPSGTFEVADGCSGLRFLIVGSALGALYGVLSFRSWKRRSIVLLAAVVLSLIANWIRVFTVIVAGHLTEMQHYLVTVDHYYFGWALFLVVFSVLLLSGRLLDEHGESEEQVIAGPAAADPGPSAGGATQDALDWKIVAVALIALIGAVLSLRAGSRPVVSGDPAVVELPARIGEWTLESDWIADSRPRFVNSDREGAGLYVGSETMVNAFAAHYSVQSQGREIVFYANQPEGRTGAVSGRSTARVDFEDGSSASFAEIEVGGESTGPRLLWYRYRIAGVGTDNEITAKLLQAVGVARRKWDAQVFVASAACVPDCDAARESLASFAADAFEPILSHIARADENSQ